jgi:surface protein
MTGMTNMKIIRPKSKDELKVEIIRAIKENGNDVDLNYIDTSEITDMSSLFENSKFNGDISNWDVSNVTNMSRIFANSKFNQDISNWDVSSVTDMEYMFYNSKIEESAKFWFPELFV